MAMRKKATSAWEITLKAVIFWSSVSLGVLGSLFLLAIERPRAPARPRPVVGLPYKGAVAVYVDLLQSFHSVRQLCDGIEDHGGGDGVVALVNLIEAEKRRLRSLDLLGVSNERHRQSLARLDDALMAGWYRIAQRLAAGGREEKGPLGADVGKELAAAQAALGNAARELSLSRRDIEAVELPLDAPGQHRAELLKAFDLVLADSPRAESPTTADSLAGRRAE